jgi:type II secretory pathway pseudopilin PulG
MMKEQSRLSYVEMIIVAVVLGVIGMRVVPQFVEASPESQISDLIDGLQKMRAQLDLYRAQHAGSLPDVDSFAGFEAAMTKKTDRYGPYVRKIPINPFNDLNTVRFNGEPAGAGTAGWRLDTETGVFLADDSDAHAGL